jgi:hypothetical protein
MNQKACPKCGWISHENQYICTHCFFHFMVNPSSSKKSPNRMGKVSKEMIGKKLEKQEKPKTQ